MKVKLKEKQPMFINSNTEQIIFFEEGEIFEVIETRIILNQNFFKLKSSKNILTSFVNSNSFDVVL